MVIMRVMLSVSDVCNDEYNDGSNKDKSDDDCNYVE